MPLGGMPYLQVPYLQDCSPEPYIYAGAPGLLMFDTADAVTCS